MRHITVVVLDRDEVATLAKAERLIDIAFPPNTDPLVPADRGVDPNHPLRRALGSLLQPYDAVSFDRLDRARQALEALWDQVALESDASYWLDLIPIERWTDMAMKHANVLAAERTGQQRLVRDAAEIVTAALGPLTPRDEPSRLRDERYESV